MCVYSLRRARVVQGGEKRCEHRKNVVNTVDVFLVCKLELAVGLCKKRESARQQGCRVWNTRTNHGQASERRVCVISVFGAFWGVFGAFWGVLGRFGAFLGVYAGPKNATPFF